jgi:hypothetical protein
VLPQPLQESSLRARLRHARGPVATGMPRGKARRARVG